MAATCMTSVTIKEEPKEAGDEQQMQNGTEDKQPATLDYNAVYGNMYRDFMANSANATNGESTVSTETTNEACKVFIPPECYADSFDIQDVVNEFKVTIEKFGVSQRFAAKYIMEDTSQGNLSFLMDKGKRLKWAELSPKGRIPYVKMKQWLDSKEKQMNTIEMVKENKAMTRQNAGRDAFQRRERFSLFQLTVLCRLFEENANPSMSTRSAIAEKLNIPPERINVWFQNQRARGFPAKRILQQSFNAAASTNGAARSASIMNSVAMDIVNQSKSDNFLANNTELVNQFVENSIYKPEMDDSDVHRLLLQYPAHSDLQSSPRSPVSKMNDSSHLKSNFKTNRSSGGSQKSDKSGENMIIKTEVDESLHKEMTINEKVNGYLNHLSQSRAKPHSGSQLDSVVKRISQSQTSAASQLQSGAAKRKPAFLNKVLAKPKGDAAVFDKYSSPFSSPSTTASGMLYDSSPLSALYRQTASVNFTPPNPSFNYLFDIGASAQMPGAGGMFANRPDMTNGITAEPRKRLHDEVTGDFGLDMKRKKTSENTTCEKQQTENFHNGSDSTHFESNNITGRREMETTVAASMKIPVSVFDKSKSTYVTDIPHKSSKQLNDSIVSNDKENENKSDKQYIVQSENRIAESNSENKTINESIRDNTALQNTDKLQTKDKPADQGTAGKHSKQGNDQLHTETAERNDDGDDDEKANAESHEKDNGICSLNLREYNLECLKDNADRVCCDETKNKNQVANDLCETAKSDSSQKHEKPKQNNGDSESDKCTANTDKDKPLSKDEMELFKSLYARFVKYHFAQMQFPEIK